MKENIYFQKRYFESIYNNYKISKVENEVAVTADENQILCKEKNSVLILTNDFKEILITVFHVHYSLFKNIDLDKYTYLNFYKDSQEKINKSDDILEIFYPYTYKLDIDKIILTKKIKTNDLDNAVKIFCLKEADLFEKDYLNRCKDRVIYTKNPKDLVRNLINFKFLYNEKILIDKLLKKEEIKETQIFLEDDYKISLALDLIKKITDIKDDVETYKIVENLLQEAVAFYEKQAIEILKKYMSDDFAHNYIIVDIYFESKEKLFEKIYKSYPIELEKELKNILKDKAQNKKAIILVKLLNSKLKNIDVHLSDCLNNLIKDLNYTNKLITNHITIQKEKLK
jgi:hypothetical protein